MMHRALAAILACLLLTPAYAQDSTAELPPFPRVEVETSAGNFTLELFTSRAPLTVRNFLGLVDNDFYSGTVFHRVVGGFVIQAGGYDAEYRRKEAGPKVPNESGNGLSNRRGFVAMARTGDPHSADSQFYINLSDNPALDPIPTRWGYAVFGRVIDGLDVVDDIGYRATGAGPVPELTADVPREAIVILSIKRLPEPENGTPVPGGN